MRSGVAGPGTLVALAGYAWWSTGLRPFTETADVSVGLPTLLLAVIAVVRPGRRPSEPGGGPSLGSCLPWLALLALGAGLEGIGLALGGRSPTVPTLSTVVDHALRWHALRFVLFAFWLAAGGAPQLHRARRGPGRAG